MTIFEQDLSQLIESLKEFIFLDINGKIDYRKVKPYHLMVQTQFPDSRSIVEASKFSLWL